GETRREDRQHVPGGPGRRLDPRLCELPFGEPQLYPARQPERPPGLSCRPQCRPVIQAEPVYRSSQIRMMPTDGVAVPTNLTAKARRTQREKKKCENQKMKSSRWQHQSSTSS